jgi:hypothetical protein
MLAAAHLQAEGRWVRRQLAAPPVCHPQAPVRHQQPKGGAPADHRPALPPTFYTIEFAALAIRGQRSAHSLATGPVMAEPAGQAGAAQAHQAGAPRGAAGGSGAPGALDGRGVPAARNRGAAAAEPALRSRLHGWQAVSAPFISPLGLTITPALSSK